MATTIKLKNGSGAPLAGDLVQGEPAFDLTNKRLYTEDSGGTVIEVGTNPGTDVTFADNRKAIFGAGSDLEIYHDGSNSYVDASGVGHLYLQAQGDDRDVKILSDDGVGGLTEYFRADGSIGEAQLFHFGSKKLNTTSTGIDVTGDVNSDSVTTGTFTSTGIDDNATSTAITIDSSENVGIGTASPAVELDVASAAPQIRLTDTDGGYCELTNVGGNLLLQADKGDTQASSSMRFDVDGTERMRIDDSGHVMIGATSTTKNFLLENPSTASGEDVSFRIKTNGTGSGADAIFEMIASTTGESLIFFGDENDANIGNIRYDHNSNAMSFITNTNEAMRIDSSGNVGIGTDSPDALLNLEANQNPVLRLGSSDGTVQVGDILGTVEFYSNDTNAPGVGAKIYAEQEDQIGAAEAGIVFETGVTGALAERMRINSDGLIGIGTASPANKLTVASEGKIQAFNSANDRSILVYNDNNAATVQSDVDPLKLQSATSVRFNSNGANERMRIDSSGNLLVGVTSTISAGDEGIQLGSNGMITTARNQTSTQTHMAFVNPNGTVGSITTLNNATSFTPSSDVRFKENIRDYDNALADVMKLKPRKYSWKADGTEDNGFIAQELLETPEFANRAMPMEEGDDPKYGVDYMKFVAVLTGAIQEQQIMIEQLKAEVAALKGE